VRLQAKQIPVPNLDTTCSVVTLRLKELYMHIQGSYDS